MFAATQQQQLIIRLNLFVRAGIDDVSPCAFDGHDAGTGLRSQGQVKEASALYDRTGIELDDTGRRIELEVRTSFSYFTESREVLESQKKVVEQAEEALRLARARTDAGTGTQLDVLSAQTALTEARSTQIQALRDYSVARARLERAVGMNAPGHNDGMVK